MHLDSLIQEFAISTKGFVIERIFLWLASNLDKRIIGKDIFIFFKSHIKKTTACQYCRCQHCRYHIYLKYLDGQCRANSVDYDSTAPRGAVESEFALFVNAIATF